MSTEFLTLHNQDEFFKTIETPESAVRKHNNGLLVFLGVIGIGIVLWQFHQQYFIPKSKDEE
jgi:hypothetical protein